MRNTRELLIAGLLATVPAFALPPPAPGPQAPLRAGEPVASIPTADSIQGFEALDNEHVMVSLAGRQQYLVTLNRACIGLRWAEHIGVSTSDNTIWAGFDAVTADGRNCPIREIHRLPTAGAPDTGDETLN